MNKIDLEAAFPKMVADLSKPGKDIREIMTDDRAHLLHMVVGIAGEAGELVDAIKRHVIYNKDLDIENIVEELGDLEFYMEGLRAALDIGRRDTIRANLEKLLTGKNARFAEGSYSDEAAQNRADKAPGADRKFFGLNEEKNNG